MNWLVRKLAGAALAGIGWKLGADAYDFVKKRIQDGTKKEKDDAEPEDEAGPEATGTADKNGVGRGKRPA